MRVGVIAPALPVSGLCQRKGTPLGRGSSVACRVRARRRFRCGETTPPWFPPPWLRSRVCRFWSRTWSRPRRGQRKLFSRARPRRPKGLSLILSPVRRDLAEAARLLLISTLCGPAQDRRPGLSGSGFNLRDVFPTGCVAGRAERAARPPGRRLRRWAELDRSRPQPIVDGVDCFDQLVVPWILRIE